MRQPASGNGTVIRRRCGTIAKSSHVARPSIAVVLILSKSNRIDDLPGEAVLTLRA
jgi:hypothetical protein